MEDLSLELKNIMGAAGFCLQEPMSRHTTFKTGGAADYFVTPKNADQIKEVLDFCNRTGIPYFILGNGSNLLVSDKGYRGLILNIGPSISQTTVEGDNIVAEAGISLARLARVACDAGLAGLEFASGIPGSLGGAITMNAGAYGGEMSRVIKSVDSMDENGRITTRPLSDLSLGYRSSIFKTNKEIVLKSRIQLSHADPAVIAEKMEELNKRRREKQPLEYPSAGSAFKRPVGYYAGKLIQDAGLAGFQIGGAAVSTKHCGFVINKDHASSMDIYLLLTEIQKKVYHEFQVKLELEVRLLGEF